MTAERTPVWLDRLEVAFLGAFALAVAAWPTSISIVEITGGVALGLFVLVAAGTAIVRRREPSAGNLRWRFTGFEPLLLAWVVAVALSLVVAPWGSPGLSRLADTRHVLAFGVASGALVLAQNRGRGVSPWCNRWLRAFVLVLIGGVVVPGIVCLVHKAGMPLKADPIDPRPRGFTDHPLTFAYLTIWYVLTGLGVIAGLWAAGPRCRRQAIVATAVLGLVSVAFVLTRSTGSLLGSALAVGLVAPVAAGLLRSRRWVVPVAAAIGLSAAALLGLVASDADLRARVFKIREGNFDSRLKLWQGALAAFEARPVTGIGFDTYKTHSLEFMARAGVSNQPAENAHNTYLELLATTGLVGLIAWLAIPALALWHIVGGLRAGHRKPRGPDRAVTLGLGLGLLTALIGYLGASFTEWSFSKDQLAPAIMAWLALCAVWSQTVRTSVNPHPAPRQ